MLGLVYEVDGRVSSPKTRIINVQFATKARIKANRYRKIKRFFSVWR